MSLIYDRMLVHDRMRQINAGLHGTNDIRSMRCSELFTESQKPHVPISDLVRKMGSQFINSPKVDEEEEEIKNITPGDWVGSNLFYLGTPTILNDMEPTETFHVADSSELAEYAFLYAGGMTNDIDGNAEHAGTSIEDHENLLRFVDPMYLIVTISRRTGKVDSLISRDGLTLNTCYLDFNLHTSGWGIVSNGSPHIGGYCCLGGHLHGLNVILSLDMTIGNFASALEEFIVHRNYNDVGELEGRNTLADCLNGDVCSTSLMGSSGYNGKRSFYNKVPYRLENLDTVKSRLKDDKVYTHVQFREWGEVSNYNDELKEVLKGKTEVEFEDVSFEEEVTFEEE